MLNTRITKKNNGDYTATIAMIAIIVAGRMVKNRASL
jgi:hypothetical protein